MVGIENSFSEKEKHFYRLNSEVRQTFYDLGDLARQRSDSVPLYCIMLVLVL